MGIYFLFERARTGFRFGFELAPKIVKLHASGEAAPTILGMPHRTSDC